MIFQCEVTAVLLLPFRVCRPGSLLKVEAWPDLVHDVTARFWPDRERRLLFSFLYAHSRD
jgi:hypothetical protein